MSDKLKEKRALQKRMKNRERQMRKRKNAKKPLIIRLIRKTPLLIIICAIAFLLLYSCGSIYVNSKVYCKYKISETAKKYYDDKNKDFFQEDGVENIVLITCYGSIENRDTSINSLSILTINNRANKVKRTELNGNLLVNIPGIGEGKLSSVMKMGGKDFLIDTIKDNLNLEISKYIAIDLNKITDSDMNKFEKYINHINNDKILSKYKLAKESLKYITTNIKLSDGVKLLYNISKMDNMKIEDFKLPIDEITSSIFYKELGQVSITDLKQSKDILHKFIYEDIEFNIKNIDLYSAKLVLDQYILEQEIYNELYGF